MHLHADSTKGHQISIFQDEKKINFESLRTSLAEKDIELDQFRKDSNRLKAENQKLKSDLGDIKKEHESLNAYISEKESETAGTRTVRVQFQN